VKIAVTGSSGLIGRALVKQLNARDDEIVEIDILADSEIYDIAVQANVAVLIRDCAGIINLAAVSRVAEAQAHPLRTWQSNVTGTQNILRYFRRHSNESAEHLRAL